MLTLERAKELNDTMVTEPHLKVHALSVSAAMRAMGQHFDEDAEHCHHHRTFKSFMKESVWHHVVLKHLPRVFAWTFSVLLLITFLGKYVDVEAWISDNTALMIVLAALVGIIPESGPHLIFVTLFAQGVLPLPVLLTSCISQDGHSGLPLLAENKRSFFVGKAINVAVAILIGFVAMWIF